MSSEVTSRATPTPTYLGLEPKVLLLIAVCSLPFFLDSLIPTLMGPLAAPIAQSLSLTGTELGAVFSANLVGQCAGLLLIPLLTRRLGHRQIILWTTLGFGLSQTLTILVADRDTLVASRFITGVFLGGALPSCVAAVTQGSPVARRGLATMLLFTAFGLGGAAAGFLASLFLQGDDWRLAFAYTGGACLIAVLVCWRWLEEPPAEQEDIAAGSGPDQGKRLIDIVSPPLLQGTLLLWLMFICALTIFYCLSSWLPKMLVDIGRSPRLAAYAVGSYTSGGVISGLLIGPLIDRFGAHRVLSLFFALSALLLFSIGQSMDSASDWSLLIQLATCGFFMLGGYGGLNVVLAGYYPAELRAVGVGWAKSIGRLGTVLPPIVIGHILSQGVKAEGIVSAFAVPSLLVMGALLLIRRDRLR
ncbi:MAG TPA: MFS transporter [Steroidobacteraceae bacterium]|nr:MFS transporter [Steroidobacteraceae bacterium]